jgi:hypothetical protein
MMITEGFGPYEFIKCCRREGDVVDVDPERVALGLRDKFKVIDF